MLGEPIQSAYLIWKSEQHILTPKYDIICSLVPLVKNCFLTTDEDDAQFKFTCQHCNVFFTYKGGSVELVYVTFINSILSTLVLHSEEIDP